MQFGKDIKTGIDETFSAEKQDFEVIITQHAHIPHLSSTKKRRIDCVQFLLQLKQETSRSIPYLFHVGLREGACTMHDSTPFLMQDFFAYHSQVVDT
jgi:hypothetical protein